MKSCVKYKLAKKLMILAVLAEEVEITMKMLGVSSLDQLRPEMVNATRLLNEMWRPEIVRAKL